MGILQKSAFAILLLFLIGTSAFAKLMEANGLSVIFEVPDDFTALTEKEISKYLHENYAPGSPIPDSIGNASREIIITYWTYVSDDSQHKVSLKKEKKDIEASLKKRFRFKTT
ncbi:MAG: hypothetical protein A2X49_00715 [Lentisphaerae bacterium GWF2_52_8]|nr:MAG: hypothetical protein A2X49_00715 [Lentisphaerae bacterium GWF2_52_8]